MDAHESPAGSPHIAEHHESGMMFSFNVAPDDGDGAAVAASG